jgi:hypothetical protein
MPARFLFLLLPLAACAACAACAADDSADPQVTIIRGDDDTDWLDLTIEAYGLDAPDGTPVLIQLGMPHRPPERLATASFPLVNGAFTVHFPQVWELGLYKQKVIHLDLDADGACTDADLVVVDFSASVSDTTLTLTPAIPGSILWGDFFLADCDVVDPDWPEQ